MKHFKSITLLLLLALIFSVLLPVFAQDDDENEECATETHPVAQALAEEFDVDVSEIVVLHCAGNGFGNIARIYLLAEASDTSVEDILAMRADGMGWGRIGRELGVHPRDFAPGQVLGNGNGNANGNGNGRGNGNANGNGNGRGNGNANGNGNGRGRGNGGSERNNGGS